MAVGETILKLTDYPFAYSILGLFSGVIGFSLSENNLVYLGIAGALGTFLTIFDPVGWLIRDGAKSRIKLNKKAYLKPNEIIDSHYKMSAIKSKSITYEIEKIIGTFYFIILIGFFIVSVAAPVPFIEQIMILDAEHNPICTEICFRICYSSLGIIAFGLLSIKAINFRKNLDEKIDIAGYHQIVINDDNATQTSVESMSRSIEQNDWEIASLWMTKIKEEIKYKKGKRELIIKSADLVFSPLHRESITFEQSVGSLNFSYRHPSFEHKEWDEITRNSYQSIIEDTDLRHRIDLFYNLALDYNKKIGPLGKIVTDIIYKYASDIFNKNQVFGIDYEIESSQGSGNVDLYGCALFNTHPLDFYRVRGILQNITIRFRDGNENQDNFKYFDNVLFDEMWELVISEVNQNDEIVWFKQIFEELKTENSKLMKIYSEKIGMQWNV